MTNESYLEQTVCEYLFEPGIEGALEERAIESEYWESAESFVNENENVKLRDLSPKQRSWLGRIKEGLTE